MPTIVSSQRSILEEILDYLREILKLSSMKDEPTDN